MNKKIIILFLYFVFIFLIGVGTGIFIGKNLYTINNPVLNGQNNVYRDKLMKLQNDFKDSGIIQGLDDKTEIKSITGKVININNNTIIIESKLLKSFLDPNLDERYIKVNNNTKIKMITKKSDEEIVRELKNAEQQGIKTIDSPSGGVSYYRSEDVSINQIQNGDLITVNSDKNIKYKKNIDALEIYFERK